MPGLGVPDGWMLLRLLSFGGWEITITAGFAGEGGLVKAELGDRCRVFHGSVADVAFDLYKWAVGA